LLHALLRKPRGIEVEFLMGVSSIALLRSPNTFSSGEPLGLSVSILEAIEPNLLTFCGVKFRWRGWGVAQPGAQFAVIGGFTMSS